VKGRTTPGERTTAPSDHAIHAPDLADLMSGERPAATVYLATGTGGEEALAEVEPRWRELRASLAVAGCPATALAGIDGLVRRYHSEEGCLAMVADETGVRFATHEPEAPRRDVARWESLPSVCPLVEWRQLAVPHVLVVADRVGADLVGVGPGQAEVHEEIEGETEPLTKSKPGGWSQRRHQQRAENTWDRNAKAVAHEVAELATSLRARLILATGDVRALSLLEEHLPDGARPDLRILTHGVGSDALADEVVRLLCDVAARDTVSVLRSWRAGLGKPVHGPQGTPAGGHRAVEGAEDTMAALRAAQVATLLVHDDPDDDRQAWWGPEPVHVALQREELEGLGVNNLRRARLVDVAVRAALRTGAGVRVVPQAGGPRDGLGALLRWSTG
jgi:hypothetical protein